MLNFVSKLFKPVANIFAKREERKLARTAADAKLKQAKVQNLQALELNKDEWEQLQVTGMKDSWKDEYVIVSVVGIINVVVLGGVLAAFGYPQVLEGVGIAVKSLSEVGVDVGFLMEAAVLSGLGLSIWKRF